MRGRRNDSVSWGRAAYGLALTFVPRLAIRSVVGRSPTGAECLVARLLGVRHVVQALALGRRSNRLAVRLGLAVDLLHLLSMLAVALRVPRRRAAALADVAVDAALIASTGRLLRPRIDP